MKVPEPLDAAILDTGQLTKARTVMAAILIVVRASRQRRTPPEAVERQLDTLTPQHYLWHWLAWKMGGFRVGADLALTPDCKVVVILPNEIIYGDPMTEEVMHLPIKPMTPGYPVLRAPDIAPVLAPGSRYKVH